MESSDQKIVRLKGLRDTANANLAEEKTKTENDANIAAAQLAVDKANASLAEATGATVAFSLNIQVAQPELTVEEAKTLGRYKTLGNMSQTEALDYRDLLDKEAGVIVRKA